MADSERVHIWSNGTEFMIWEKNNCGRCVKATTEDSDGCCDLDDAIGLACLGDGLLAPEIATRLGYAGEPFFFCKEFQGRGKPEPKPAAREMRDAGATPLPGFDSVGVG
jgi:hypothetical protein